MNNPANQKSLRATRPDKPLFFAMISAFFFLIAATPAYWAFYNYGEYRQTSAFIEELKTESEQFLMPDEKKEKESRISLLGSRAERFKLEMILSGAGSFVLFGIALLLFAKALRIETKRIFITK